MAQETFCYLSTSVFEYAAFVGVGRADFSKTAVKIQKSAGLTQNFLRSVAADVLHGRIPGGNSPPFIQCKYAFGHGIKDLI
jgi:hypothetical protein